MTMTWQNGRELATLAKDGKTISYAYNADGIRTEKNNNGVVTKYFYDSNNNLISLICGDIQLVFYYDADGQADSFTVYSGNTATRYYYVKNLQGDITKIMTADGAVVANYYYDAYGEILSITDADGDQITDASSVAFLNPLRYRGYVYDDDTGFYYLQSRYYDPITKRFINADDVFYLGVSGNITGYNLFSYCENNPIVFADRTGNWIHIAIGALVGGLIGILGYFVVEFATAILNNKKFKVNGWQLFWSFAGGAVSGALSAACTNMLIQKIGTAIISLTTALASGSTVIEAVFITVISVMLVNSGGVGKQFSKLSKNLLSKLKNPKNVAKIVNGLIYYIKSTGTLYKKFFKELFKSNAKTWAAQFGYKFATKRR